MTSNKENPGQESPVKRTRAAPRKSILKFVNGLDDDLLDPTQTMEISAGRKSIARRVSFAAHAQVRLFNKEGNPEGSASNSPGDPPAPTSSRRSSVSSTRRRSSIQRPSGLPTEDGEPYEDDDSSMDIEQDDIPDNAPLVVSQNLPQPLQFSPDQSLEQDDNMEFTSVFNNNIFLPPPLGSSPPPSDEGEPMEFTVALEQSILPSKRMSSANEAWAQLQALALAPSQHPPPELGLDPFRMKVAVGAAPSSASSDPIPSAENPLPGDDSIESRTDIDLDDQTMDLTSIVQPQYLVDLDDNAALPPPPPPTFQFTFSQSSQFEDSIFSSEPQPSIFSSTFPFVTPSSQTSDSSDSQSQPFTQPEDVAQPLHGQMHLSTVSQPLPHKPPVSDYSPRLVASQPDLTVTSINHSPPIASPSRKPRSSTLVPRRSVTPTPTSSSVVAPKSPRHKSLPPTFTASFAPLHKATSSRASSQSPSKRAGSPVKASPRKKAAIGNTVEDLHPVPVIDSVEPTGEPTTESSSEPQLPPTVAEPLLVEDDPHILAVQSTTPEQISHDLPRRRSSSFAQRMAKKTSLAGRLSVVPEQAEISMSTNVVQPISTAKESSDNEGSGNQWDDYQEEIGELSTDLSRAGPKISLNEVLDMAGIHFHEEMPVQRRHTLGHNMMTMNDGTLGPIPPEAQDFSLTDYYSAEAIDLALLDIYTWATQEIKHQMSEYKQELPLLTEEIEENPPNALLDFLEADEELRTQIETVFKLAKTFAKRTTRGEWYRWRSKWTSDLQPAANAEVENLESHLAFIEGHREKLSVPVGELRQQHALLKAELDKERIAVAEIEACDPDQLDGLRAGIAEQNTVIEGYHTDIAYAMAELERSKSHLDEKQNEHKVAQRLINSSKRQGEVLGTTHEDVLRGRADFHQLQNLHMWKLVKASKISQEWEHDRFLRVVITCDGHATTPRKVTIEKLESISEKWRQFGVLTGSMVSFAQDSVNQLSFTSTELIIRHLDALFGSYSKVLAEMRLLEIKYPLRFDPHAGYDEVHVAATVLVRPKSKPQFKGKAVVTFILTMEAISGWPTGASSIDIRVNVVYGSMSSSDIVASIKDRLASITSFENYGALLDACGEIQSQYD